MYQSFTNRIATVSLSFHIVPPFLWVLCRSLSAFYGIKIHNQTSKTPKNHQNPTFSHYNTHVYNKVHV
nr:MAG TPA: protein of unknown function (DUF4291) [Caudoviricetes sp.]